MHASGQIAVVQTNGVETFDADRLGIVGGQIGIVYSDVGGAVNRRRTCSVGGIGSAVHDHGAAASVRADRRGGSSLGLHVQIPCIKRAAACDMDSAGSTLRSCYRIVGSVDDSVSVRKDSCAARGVCVDG